MSRNLPDSMTCIEIRQPGGPEVLVPTTRPVPQPGDGEVLVKVAAAGVNRPDVLQRAGGYPPPPGASDIPGLELAGTIVALGANVEGPALGDEICALVAGGGYAEYCVASAALVLPVPKVFDLEMAAAIPETFFTVWTNVFDRGRLRAGETILIHGGSSGIGTTAIQLAKRFGATVLTTVGNDAKVAACLGLGADRAINYRTEDYVQVIKEMTDGRGVDLVLDMVGGDYISRNVSVLAVEGRLVQIAFLQTSKVGFDFLPMMLKRLTITGSTLRPRTVAQKAEIAAALREKVWPLFEAGTVKPVMHASFPLVAAAKAHAMMEESLHIGKIMLTT